MFDGMEMFSRMLVFRRIAAAYVAAGHAQAQVNPSVTHFQTFLTPICVRPHVSNLIGVSALRHFVPPEIVLGMFQSGSPGWFIITRYYGAGCVCISAEFHAGNWDTRKG
jgi:hypothetical protein